MNALYEFCSSRRVHNAILSDCLFVFLAVCMSMKFHLTCYPIRLFEPMRLLLLCSLLLCDDRRSALLLAFIMPLSSCLVVGCPMLTFACLMSWEFAINILMFFLLKSKIENNFLSMSLAILISKLVYYGLKYSLILFGILNTDVFSTPALVQLCIVLMTSGLFTVASSKKRAV